MNNMFLRVIIFLKDKFILRKSTGYCIKKFAEKSGPAYIKLAQILAVQNIGNIFTEEDRRDLLHICDDCNVVDYEEIDKVLREEFGSKYYDFHTIEHEPVGAASISQVHSAYLPDGRRVVLKVKRKDITSRLEKDISFMKFVSKHFGGIIGLHNLIGSQEALSMYLGWILTEIDFRHEVENIKEYKVFSESVNGSVDGCVSIVLPDVYEEYCTDNVICMSYIPYKTISNIDDRSKTPIILNALSSYFRLSFNDLFYGDKVVFHGDPHAGNIYIDDEGNIGFLDMGLTFALSKHDMRMVRKLFFSVYCNKPDVVFKLLTESFVGSEEQLEEMYNDIIKCIKGLKNKPVTQYFMDMVLVCFKYNVKPPQILFCMAKAFVCLSGLDIVYDNGMSGVELLEEQIIAYVISCIKNACSTGLEFVTILPLLTVVDNKRLVSLISRCKDVVERVTDFI